MQAEVDAYTKEHDSAEEITFELLDAIMEADWEKVMRLVTIYAPLVRTHMDKEEKRVHIAAAFDIAGFGISFDISLGMRFGFSPPLPGTDSVLLGCTTVWIG